MDFVHNVDILDKVDVPIFEVGMKSRKRGVLLMRHFVVSLFDVFKDLEAGQLNPGMPLLIVLELIRLRKVEYFPEMIGDARFFLES